MQLDNELKQQLKQYLRLMEGPVQFQVSPGQLPEDTVSAQMMAMLCEIAELTPLLSVRQTTLPRSPSFRVTRPDEQLGVTFAGIPQGHHFSSLVLAIVQVSGRPPKINSELVQRIKAIKQPYHFESYISVGCHHCPDLVQNLHLMSILNPLISHTAVDGAIFRAEVDEKQIMTVPTVYVNGEFFGSGQLSLEQILHKLGYKNQSLKAVPNETYDVLVIGGGPAGATAALYASRQGAHTCIVAERFGGHVVDNFNVDQLLGLKAGESSKMVANLEEFVFDYGIDVMNLQRAKELSVQQISSAGTAPIIEVRLENDVVLRSKTLILATGTSWRSLGVPGEQALKNHGVSHCAECVGPLYEDKYVVVIGGGQSGVEAALYLSNIARHVTVLEQQPSLTADRSLQKKLLRKPNVTVLTDAQVTAIKGSGRVQGLTYISDAGDAQLAEARTLQADGIIIQIGRVPNTQWVPAEIKRNEWGELLVNSFGATNIPGVYAAGDCTDSPFKQIIISMGSGATTAFSAVAYLHANDKEPT